MKIPTSAFLTSYCIGISGDPKIYAKYLKEKSYDLIGVAVISDQNNISMIVIPNSQNFNAIEKDLFEFMEKTPELKDSGFWGRLGLSPQEFQTSEWTKIEP